MAEDYLAKVKAKEEEQGDLIKRWDDDKKLQYLEKYVMRDKDDKVVPNIINVTLPDTAIFSANVVSALGKASQQGVVESDDKKLDTTYIEEFHDAGFASANARLKKMGRPELNPFFDEQVCLRGRGAARCLFRMGDEGILIPDIMPWDTRYVTYDIGEEGIEWAAYKTKRTKGMIEAEYGVIIEEKTAEVVDVWHKEGNEVWIAGKKEFEQGHDYGFTPIVYVVVPLGSMLADEDALAHQGESIFFLIRDVVPELNRLVSMAQTTNMQAVIGALQYESDVGARAEPPTHEDVTAPASVTSVDKGGGLKPVPIQDLQRAFDRVNATIETRLQRGSLSSIDLGTLQFQLSAVALVEIGEGRDQVFLPRLQAKALLNQGLADMFTEQVIQIGGNVELGTPEHKRTFQVGKLEGEYETSYKYFVKSPKIDIARYSVAAAAGDLVSRKTKMADILQLEDPAGEESRLRYEEAERLSPAIKLNRTIESLIEEGKEFEAELLSTEMGVSLQAMLAGEVGQLPKPEEAEKPTPMMPMFSRGGRGEQLRREAEPPTEPVEEETE